MWEVPFHALNQLESRASFSVRGAQFSPRPPLLWERSEWRGVSRHAHLHSCLGEMMAPTNGEARGELPPHPPVAPAGRRCLPVRQLTCLSACLAPR